MAAGITIYAPAIILATILDVPLSTNVIIIGLLVVVYTITGGTHAVSHTQKQQMIVIFIGMIVAFVIAVQLIGQHIGFLDGLHLAGQMGKMEMVSIKWDLGDRYNIISALLGGTFLFLSYFGTDQSQVQRYLSAENIRESRLGLLFNGLVKVPMQFTILLTGILVFILFQFHDVPAHFNPRAEEALTTSSLAADYLSLKKDMSNIHDTKTTLIYDWSTYRHEGRSADAQNTMDEIRSLNDQYQSKRAEVSDLVTSYNESSQHETPIEENDKDYVFLYYVLHFLPIGVIGLLFAVIFSASMSFYSSRIKCLGYHIRGGSLQSQFLSGYK